MKFKINDVVMVEKLLDKISCSFNSSESLDKFIGKLGIITDYRRYEPYSYTVTFGTLFENDYQFKAQELFYIGRL